MVSPEQVDAYFQAHLMRDQWFAEAAERRKAAVNMAYLDVSAELQGAELDGEDSHALAAVSEQALFLLLNPGSLNSGQAHLASESVEGIGSRSYRTGGGMIPGFSLRAAKYINLIRGSTGTIRLSRG